MTKSYFKRKDEDPDPLSIVVPCRVRFEETDPLGIVWHGRYASYFEEGRVAHGDRFGMGYLECYNSGIVTPIKKMHIDYHLPLKLMERFTVECILHWTDALRINYEFIIRNSKDEIATTGYTVQVVLDRDTNNLLLVPPPFVREFREKWKSGGLT